MSVMRSLARFMAEYLDPSRSEMNVCAPLEQVAEWPSLRSAGIHSSEDEDEHAFRVRIEKEKLVAHVSRDDVEGVPLSRMFTPDKVVELMLVTGLFDEAVYFLNCNFFLFIYNLL